MMNTAAIYILYNPDLTLLNKSLSVCLDLVDHIYIIDNSDEDMTEYFASIKYRKVSYIALSKNMGIAYALNIGCQIAKDEGYIWALTMDQDSIPPFNMITDYINYLKQENNSKIALVGCVSKAYIGENIRSERKVYVDAVNIYTSGSFMNLIIWAAVGGFNEELFIDCVDYEYCLRLLQNCFEVHQLGYVVLEHKLGDTHKYRFCGRGFYVTNHNYVRRYYITRNLLWVRNKYKDAFSDIEVEGKVSSMCKIVFKILFFERDKWRKIRSIYRGYMDFQKNKMGVY